MRPAKFGAISAKSGFGTSVARELVPYELGGTAELTHLPKGVCCNLHIPPSKHRAKFIFTAPLPVKAAT